MVVIPISTHCGKNTCFSLCIYTKHIRMEVHGGLHICIPNTPTTSTFLFASGKKRVPGVLLGKLLVKYFIRISDQTICLFLILTVTNERIVTPFQQSRI